MNDEQSPIKKTETLIDDLIDLWRRRRKVCILVVLIVLLPLAVSVISIPLLKASLTKAEKERDKAQLQLAPFLAAANQHFQDVPEDKRLESLSEKLDDMLETVQTGDKNILIKLTSIDQAVGALGQSLQASSDRSLSPPVAERLTSSLKAFPDWKVHITCQMGDGEAHSFAEQLKIVFTAANWEVNGVNQALFNKPVRKLVLKVGKAPPQPLQRAIMPLFDALGYKREAFLDPSVKEKEIEIVVGSK